MPLSSVNQDFRNVPFIPFTGIVEDILDPLQIGRVRVRAIGFHTPDKTLLPTDDLPWASVVMPVTSASAAGVGTSPTGLLTGSWVFGFFRDGASAQDMLILGSMHGIPVPISEKIQGPANLSSGAYTIHSVRGFNLPDIPDSAQTSRWTESRGTVQMEASRVERVPRAVPPRVPSVLADSDEPEYYSAKTWSFPTIADVMRPVYPHNHVHRSVSGHQFEVDDTPGFERITRTHRSGTNEQMLPDGSRIVSVVGNGYEVVCKDKNVYIKGECSITIEGDARTLVRGNYHLEVEGNKTEYIKGSSSIKIGGSLGVEVTGSSASNVGGDSSSSVTGTETSYCGSGRTTTIKEGGSKLSVLAGDSLDLVVGNRLLATTGNFNCSSTGFTSASNTITLSSATTVAIAGPGGVGVTGPTSVSGTTSFTGASTTTGTVNVTGPITATGTVTAPLFVLA